MGEKMFPMQRGPDIPWVTAEPIYEAYAMLYGSQQSMQCMAERGGFSWQEVEVIFGELHRKKPGEVYRLAGRNKFPSRAN